MNFRDLDKKLQKEFSQKKLKAEWIASQNKARLNKSKSWQKLDSLERELVFELSKAKADKKPHADLAESLKTVRTEKQKLLKIAKLSPADLEPKYECSLCGDVGFVGGKMCECYKKRRNQEIIKMCGLNLSSGATFDKFNTDICGSEKHAQLLTKLKDKLMLWADKYPKVKKRNILIAGTPGGGKTYITECLANEMLKKDYSVCFVSAFDMNNMFLKYHTTFDSSKNSWLEPLLSADILFVDDLGTEPIMKNVTLNYLFLLLSERERFGKPIVVTTNLLPENILDRYGERIYSRLNNKLSSMVVYVEGDDLRLGNNFFVKK